MVKIAKSFKNFWTFELEFSSNDKVISAQWKERSKVEKYPSTRGDVKTKKAADIISSYFEGNSVDLTKIPLETFYKNKKFEEAQVPPFFKEVYRQLRQVPFGEVVTYQWLAKKSSSPKAMRAVGQAMAKNPWPLLVPCHRVIQTTGALGNYSAVRGPELKALLLKHEGVNL